MVSQQTVGPGFSSITMVNQGACGSRLMVWYALGWNGDLSMFIHNHIYVLLGDRMVLKILLLASAYVLTVYGVLLLAKFIDQRTNKLQP